MAADGRPATPALTPPAQDRSDSPRPEAGGVQSCWLGRLGVRASLRTPGWATESQLETKVTVTVSLTGPRHCSCYNMGEIKHRQRKTSRGKKQTRLRVRGGEAARQGAGEEGQVPSSQQWQLRTRGSWPRAWPRPWCGQRGLQATWQLLMVCVTFQPGAPLKSIPTQTRQLRPHLPDSLAAWCGHQTGVLASRYRWRWSNF